MMEFDAVICHVEAESGLDRTEFSTSSAEVRIFSTAHNVGGECVIRREKMLGANGDQTKRLVHDKLHLNTEDIEKSGHFVSAYKIIGINNNTYTSPPLSVKKYLKNTQCVFFATSARPEIDHKYDYHMEWYDDIEFAKNVNNWQIASSTANDKKRQEKQKRKESGFKFDNRRVGFAFSTTRFSLKDTPDLFIASDPFDGVYWTDPIQTHKEDRMLYGKYLLHSIQYDSGMTIEKFEKEILPKINGLICNIEHVQNIDVILGQIL